MRWILIFLVVVIAGLQYRLWFGRGSWEQITELNREIDQQQQINERLRDRNRGLENEVSAVNSGLESG